MVLVTKLNVDVRQSRRRLIIKNVNLSKAFFMGIVTCDHTKYHKNTV